MYTKSSLYLKLKLSTIALYLTTSNHQKEKEGDPKGVVINKAFFQLLRGSISIGNDIHGT
jgi:hypothetical protein